MTVVDYVTVLSSALIALIGGLLLSSAFRGYLRTERRTMAYLTVGFSLIVVAAVIAAFGVISETVGVSPEILTLQTSITALGYVLVVLGVLSHRPMSA